MISVNTLNVQTSSNVFSLVVELTRRGCLRGAVIGIGNDVALWTAISAFTEHITIYESDPTWLSQCFDYSARLQSSLSSDRQFSLSFKSFQNQIYKSAFDQYQYLTQLNKSLTPDLVQIFNNHKLSHSLASDLPDWIYVDGPLGGYNSETSYQKSINRGRMETIICSALYLSSRKSNQPKYLIVDDCQRFIEKMSIELLAPLIVPKSTIHLGRDTYAFAISGNHSFYG